MRHLFILGIFALFVHLSSCQTWQRGEQIYIDMCSNCHGPKGQGFAQLYPALDNKKLFTHRMDSVLHIIVNGRSSKDSTGMITSQMFPIEKLSLADYTNLLNYLNHQFGDPNTSIALDTTRSWLSDMNINL